MSASLLNKVNRLEFEVDSLQSLFVGIYERFLFLRPMMVHQGLTIRMGNEVKGICFRQLRMWLYWNLIQELVKICDDKFRRKRALSIRTVTNDLQEPEITREVERRYVAQFHRIEGEPTDALERLREYDEQEFRREFQKRFRRIQDSARFLFQFQPLEAYATIRNKRIAHNELCEITDGYALFEPKGLKLKFGDEKAVITRAKEIVDDLSIIVRRVDFDWEHFIVNETREVCRFWDIAKLDDRTSING